MTENKKRIVIIGATSAIAMHCARLWVSEAPIILTLVCRNAITAEECAADLRVRSPHSLVQIATLNFLQPLQIQKLANNLVQEGPIDLLFIAHGSLPDQKLCQQDIHACQDALAINALSPVLFAEAFASHMESANHGTLAIIGSVAGDRGRKSNYVYGAAKGLITRYAEGLQHRFAASKVLVILIKPGPTNTPMTAHLQQRLSTMAEPGEVAKIIVDGIKKGKPVIYAPAKWAIIMMVIRHLPSFVFNKLDI